MKMVSLVRERRKLYFSDSRPKLEEDINVYPRFTQDFKGIHIYCIHLFFPFFSGSRLRTWETSQILKYIAPIFSLHLLED